MSRFLLFFAPTPNCTMGTLAPAGVSVPMLHVGHDTSHQRRPDPQHAVLTVIVTREICCPRARLMVLSRPSRSPWCVKGTAPQFPLHISKGN